MPKLMWISDATNIPYVGQSVVGRECLSRLQQYYDIDMLGFGASEVKDPLKVSYNLIPCERKDCHNVDKMTDFLNKSKPDVVLMSHDPWILPTIGDLRARFPKTKFIGWLTIDGSPAYYLWRPLIKPYHKVLCPTKFSADTLTDRWFDLDVKVVPYGINHAIFHPPAQGKDELKRQLQNESEGRLPIGNKFVGLYVGANQDRKNLGLIHEAWREFEKGKENKVVMLMFVHSASLTQEVGTYDLSVFVSDTKSLFVNMIPQPLQTIGQIMASSDILFHPSSGESWGLSVSEALACGTVPVTIPYAGVTDFINENNSYGIKWSPFVGGYHCQRAFGHLDDAVKQLNQAYNNKEERAAKSVAGVEAVKHLTWENTVAMLKEQIDEVLGYKENQIFCKRIV